MCDFECLFGLEERCLLDKEPCDSDCVRYKDCRYCEHDCEEREMDVCIG